MKTSNVLASLLCSSLAAAVPHHQHVHKHAPFHKRALVTKTELVVETVLIFTTVYPDDTPAATVAPAATSEPGLFYEKPSSKKASSSAPAYTPPAEPAKPSSSSVYTPPPAPSSVYTPPPAPSSVYTPPPAESSSVYTPPPAESSSIYTPAAVSSAAPAAAPAQSSAPASGGGATGGSEHYSGDITIYDNTGAAGACGEPLYDSMEICAIAQPLWDKKGGSTYDRMTGKATNPYCGKYATITYNGNTITCQIMDLCPGCTGNDLDLSVKSWKALTGSDEKTRYQATWSVAM